MLLSDFKIPQKWVYDAFINNQHSFPYIDEQDPHLCFEAVQINGFYLKYVKEQIPRI